MMNFRDVLKALGIYPAESADARIFGDEVSGFVKEVGKNVTHLKPGASLTLRDLLTGETRDVTDVTASEAAVVTRSIP